MIHSSLFAPIRQDSLQAGRRIWLRRSVGSAIAACLMLALPLGAQQAPKEPTKLDLTFIATADVNGDDKGNPSPIEIRLFELKLAEAFVQADYFSLREQDKTVLGADMLVRDVFILRPGEKKIIRRKSHTETTALGILAGYRDLAKTRWREAYVLPPAPEASWLRFAIPANQTELVIQLQTTGIQINPAK